jgi:hypothetical protein
MVGLLRELRIDATTILEKNLRLVGSKTVGNRRRIGVAD